VKGVVKSRAAPATSVGERLWGNVRRNMTARNESAYQSPLHECDPCTAFVIKAQSPTVRGDQSARTLVLGGEIFEFSKPNSGAVSTLSWGGLAYSSGGLNYMQKGVKMSSKRRVIRVLVDNQVRGSR
jgi:hypothetical protein